MFIYIPSQEVDRGLRLHRHYDRIVRYKLAFCETRRMGIGGAMELFYWIGGILAAGLLVYLVIALLKPEALS